MCGLSEQLVAKAFEQSCLDELDAIKPGNVGHHAAGHGMSVRDFEKSALAASASIARHGATIGERIRSAVVATRRSVGQNTNLGIVLLCAPLAHAAQTPTLSGPLALRSLKSLQTLSVEDANDAFAAITLASPAGLGVVPEHDVRAPARLDLREAMRAASHRDRIAAQYTCNFRDIYLSGWSIFKQAVDAGVSPDWCTSAVYLRFLSAFCDSHVVRKHNAGVAERVRLQGTLQFDRLSLLLQSTEPDFNEFSRQLILLDRDWKSKAINPGTSADLTVATLFSVRLEQLLRGEKRD